MATDVEKLVVQLSADFRSFQREMAKSVGVTNRQFSAIERRARQMNKNLDNILSKSMSGLKAGVSGVGAAIGADQLRKLTDTWTDMTSRVNIAAGSLEKGQEVMGRLGEMARRTYSDLEMTAESYLGNSTAVQELGYNTDKALDYTEALNNALVVSAAKGQRAESVQNALADAMALGKLSGNNLNTVITKGGRVAEALAAGLGTTTSGLKRMGAQGKITGKDIVDSLTSQMETLRREAETMPATISDGITLLNNALLEYVGGGDSAIGISGKVAEALIIIADNFDQTADAALMLAGVFAGGLLGRSIFTMIGNLGLGVKALNDFRKALAAAQTMAGLAGAFGGLSAAAGPVSMIISGAVVGSLILYSKTVGDSSEGARLFAARLKEVEDAAKASGDAVEGAGRKNASYNLNSIKAEARAGAEEFERAKQAVSDYFDEIIEQGIVLEKVRDEQGKFSRQPMATPEQFNQLQELRERLSKNSDQLVYIKDALQALANSNPNFQALANQLDPLLDKLINVALAARNVNAELADKNAARGRSAKDDALPVDPNKFAAEAYEKEALRKASLNKKEHALEMERIKVRNDALKDNTTLTEASIDRIARANLAAQERWSADGKKPKEPKAPKKTEDDYFFQITQQVKDRTVALAEEAKITGLTFIEQEKRRTALELEQDVLSRLREEARKKGDKDWENIKLTPEQVSSIDAVSEAYARQADELRKIQDAQYDAERAAAEFADTIKSGFVDAVTGASSLQDALSGILKKLAEMILNSAFDKLFNGASASGGWLTGAMKAIGFAEGGYTGSGGVNQPAGVVHKGEVVWSQKDVARAGGVAAVEAMRRGVRGYSAGGAVAMPVLKAPTMPILKAPSNGGGSAVINFAPVINAPNADKEGLARVEKQLAKMQREMPATVIQTIRKAQNSNVSLG